MKTVQDIMAFGTTYDASLVVIKRIVPFIPAVEAKLRDQLAEVVKDIPCTIAAEAEGGQFKQGSNPNSMALNFIGEAMVLIRYCRDLHERHINQALCDELLAQYERARQEIRGTHQAVDQEAHDATLLS